MLAACGFHGPPPLASGDDATPAGDAAIGDAAVIGPPCPELYPGGYRYDATPRTWLDAERACEADTVGRSHLVVMNDDAERAMVVAAIPVDVWVGIVRDPGGTAPWPWRYVTGGAATFAPWESSEPNNLSGDQYVAGLRKASGMIYDYGAANLVGSLCECDGMPPVNADFDPATP